MGAEGTYPDSEGGVAGELWVVRVLPDGLLEPEILVLWEQRGARREERHGVLALNDAGAPLERRARDREGGGIARVVVQPVVRFAPDVFVRVVLG